MHRVPYALQSCIIKQCPWRIIMIVIASLRGTRGRSGFQTPLQKEERILFCASLAIS